MPTVLESEAIDAWLDPTNKHGETLSGLLHPAPKDDWTLQPVSAAVNNTRHDTSELLVPLKDAGP